MSASPRIFIVIPCHEQVAFREEVIRSVLDQRNVDVGLIVMDPGSTDGSCELLRRLMPTYGERPDLHFEKDEGQSDAIDIADRGRNPVFMACQSQSIPSSLGDFRVHPNAKSSMRTFKGINAAYKTDRQHTKDLGLPGEPALLLHHIFSFSIKPDLLNNQVIPKHFTDILELKADK